VRSQSLELSGAGDAEPAVAHTGGDDDGLAQQLGVVFEHHVAIATNKERTSPVDDALDQRSSSKPALRISRHG
jgi:hypothetical protein